MALRLRRDVQKASYYVWFLGAEEAKGLRGARVINSVLPYLIDRSRGQEPLKVTLQVSHKGIKILQGSSKHFIPHSAITSSVQTDDIVACVLLLYNPATKCPLHVHAYRCDSESTAEALHQQLQILINRPENQKRFEELESRLGILPPLPTAASTSATSNSKSVTSSHINNERNQKQQHYQSQQQQRRQEASPKRFSSSLGSDTGNSTRESECSEEHSGGSPISRSPPIIKPLPLQNNELFDSLAAELRAKLNGNGPPLLLPPRDYDTVHRSKGNLAAIELRRCRNALIVGSTTPNTPTHAATATATTTATANGKQAQVSSRGSSGIGSDLAPSPERQELNSSSDDEHWSNEADNSVIALKPSQIQMEHSAPIIPHHPLLNRKSAVKQPDDSYLRDLPAKPYNPMQNNNGRGKTELRSKTSATASWTREDEIKPIIMRPADYDAKFNRVLQAEQKQATQRRNEPVKETPPRTEHAKLRDTDKYNEINRLLNKKLSLERESPEHKYKTNKARELEDDFDDSDPSSEHLPLPHVTSNYCKENLTDKQKFIEYSTKKQSKSYAAEDAQRYGGRNRYVDPADLPFEQPSPPPLTAPHNKYAAVHRGTERSPERSDLGHRTAEREKRERYRGDDQPSRTADIEAARHQSRDREPKEREHYSRSNERNPYNEPESIPYIKSMEKMMKSSALRYKSYDGPTDVAAPLHIHSDEAHVKLSQRSKSYPKHEDDLKPEREYNYTRARPEYAASAGSGKDRYKEAKEKIRAKEHASSRYDLHDEPDSHAYRVRHRSTGSSIGRVDAVRALDDWSDEERCDDSPPSPAPNVRSRSRARDDHWQQNGIAMRSERDMLPPRERDLHHMREREPLRDQREYARSQPTNTGKRSEPRDLRDSHEMYDPRDRYEPRSMPRMETARERPRDHHRAAEREHRRDHSREYALEHGRRDYAPPSSAEHQRAEYTGRSLDKQQRMPLHPDMYPPSPTPPSSNGAEPRAANAKNIANMSKGYRHSYAEPVFARAGGRVGLAAVNPY